MSDALPVPSSIKPYVIAGAVILGALVALHYLRKYKNANAPTATATPNATAGAPPAGTPTPA